MKSIKENMMEKKYIKPAIIAGVVLLLILWLAANGAVEKIGRLGTIGANIATNLSHASHGDPRPIESMSVDYIKENTGSSKTVNIKELPRAFVPLKKHGHPPFSMGACNICHSPKRSKPAAIVTHTVSELCYKCHEPVKVINDEMKALDCNKCHSPHQADRKKLVRDNVTVDKCPSGEFH